jgi:hypothetical protein
VSTSGAGACAAAGYHGGTTSAAHMPPDATFDNGYGKPLPMVNRWYAVHRWQ